MSGRHRLLAGLVVAVLLLGLGFLLGHVTSTTGDSEREAWEARTDSLLGAQADRHRQAVAQLASAADAAEAQAVAAVDRARVAEAGRARADARSDSLRTAAGAMDEALAEARTTADSVRFLLAKVGLLEEERDLARAQVRQEREIGEQYRLAYLNQVQATAALRARVAAHSTRITTLEGQLADAPGPSRWRLRLWRFDVRPSLCATYPVVGLGDGDVALGPGACITP